MNWPACGARTAMTTDRDAQAASLASASATIGGLQAQIGGLQAQVAAQAQGGATAVIAGGPNAMWTAIVAIWQAFPMLPPVDSAATTSPTASPGAPA
jgi:hypothetical protein